MKKPWYIWLSFFGYGCLSSKLNRELRYFMKPTNWGLYSKFMLHTLEDFVLISFPCIAFDKLVKWIAPNSGEIGNLIVFLFGYFLFVYFTYRLQRWAVKEGLL